MTAFFFSMSSPAIMNDAVSPVGRKPPCDKPFQPPNSVYWRSKFLFCTKNMSNACGLVCGIRANIITTRSLNVISCRPVILSNHLSIGGVTSSIEEYSHPCWKYSCMAVVSMLPNQSICAVIIGYMLLS